MLINVLRIPEVRLRTVVGKKFWVDLHLKAVVNGEVKGIRVIKIPKSNLP